MADEKRKETIDFVKQLRDMAKDKDLAKQASQAVSGGTSHRDYLKSAWGAMPTESPSRGRMAAKRAALLSKLGRGAKMVPILGTAIGALSALKSGDIMAATGVGDSADTGPAEGSLDSAIEGGEGVPEEARMKLMAEARRKAIEEMSREGHLVE